MAKGRIVIDPGHGGQREIGDSSANNAVSASGIPEKVLTLQLAHHIRQALEDAAADGHQLKVFLTRSDDTNLGLRQRARVAKTRKADLFLSIHFNGFNGSARGVETLIRPASAGNLNPSQDRAFAKRIQKHVVAAIQARDPETRDRGVKSMRLGVLRDEHLGNTEQAHPCRACLLEVEFIDLPAVDQLRRISAPWRGTACRQ